MRENVLAKRYAQALFELAKEKGILESIRNEMELFNNNLQSNQPFRHFLNSQEINKREKARKIEALFQDRVSNVFFNFLLVLLKKNRQSIFSIIAKQFELIFDRYLKKVRASAITAVPLDECSLLRLKQTLSKRLDANVQIQNSIDPNIIAGIIIKVDGQVIDGSLKSQLNRLKYQLTENSNSEMV
ncbi:MAG: ATP synthase F1 subunit delta [bacterium]